MGNRNDFSYSDIAPEQAAEDFARDMFRNYGMWEHAESLWDGNYAVQVKNVETGKISVFSITVEMEPIFTAEEKPC